MSWLWDALRTPHQAEGRVAPLALAVQGFCAAVVYGEALRRTLPLLISLKSHEFIL